MKNLAYRMPYVLLPVLAAGDGGVTVAVKHVGTGH